MKADFTNHFISFLPQDRYNMGLVIYFGMFLTSEAEIGMNWWSRLTLEPSPVCFDLSQCGYMSYKIHGKWTRKRRQQSLLKHDLLFVSPMKGIFSPKPFCFWISVWLSCLTGFWKCVPCDGEDPVAFKVLFWSAEHAKK